MTFAQFGREHIPAIDGFISDYFTGKMASAEHRFMADFYGDILEYLNRDGKRIRPLVLMASYLGYRRRFRKTGEAVKAASVLEIMHAMLLIQDDLIDRATLRRGGPAFHLLMRDKYSSYTLNGGIGNDIAIILADIIFADSLEIISGIAAPRAVKDRFLQVFSRTYQVTAWGQLLDSLYSLSTRIAEAGDVPMLISTMKTSHYTIFYPLLMGYVLSGKNDRQEISRIREFSIPLGIAFQLRDDIQGVFASGDEIGKSADSDIREGKLTLLVQYALEALGGGERDRFMELFLREEKSDGDVGEIRGMIDASGARGRAGETHRALVGEALRKLRRLSVPPETAGVLGGLVDLIAAV
ncbi:MAG: polyprenyl synthetase family protein [Spirochaetes bacterium]|nr:polyprenyl synthetase family protein [Spirochaetota bacterium]